MNILSLAISILGLLGGLSSWLYIWYLNRVKFSLSILSKLISHKGTLLYICFVNESRLPISLTKITLIENDNYRYCSAVPKLVYHSTLKTGDTITHEDKHYSMQIPINLSALSAKSGYLFFPSAQETPLSTSNVLIFEVQTNRGVTKKMTLELPQENLR